MCPSLPRVRAFFRCFSFLLIAGNIFFKSPPCQCPLDSGRGGSSTNQQAGGDTQGDTSAAHQTKNGAPPPSQKYDQNQKSNPYRSLGDSLNTWQERLHVRDEADPTNETTDTPKDENVPADVALTADEVGRGFAG